MAPDPALAQNADHPVGKMHKKGGCLNFSFNFLATFCDRLAPPPPTRKDLKGRTQVLFTFCIPRARHSAGHKAGP